MTAGIVRVV